MTGNIRIFLTFTQVIKTLWSWVAIINFKIQLTFQFQFQTLWSWVARAGLPETQQTPLLSPQLAMITYFSENKELGLWIPQSIEIYEPQMRRE